MTIITANNDRVNHDPERLLRYYRNPNHRQALAPSICDADLINIFTVLARSPEGWDRVRLRLDAQLLCPASERAWRLLLDAMDACRERAGCLDEAGVRSQALALVDADSGGKYALTPEALAEAIGYNESFLHDTFERPESDYGEGAICAAEDAVQRLYVERVVHAALRNAYRDDSPGQPMQGVPCQLLDIIASAQAALEARGGCGGDTMESPEQWCAEEDAEPLVADVFVRGQLAVIGGPQKTAKTILGADMAVALATGTPWLDRFTVPRPMRTGFISVESGKATIGAKVAYMIHRRMERDPTRAQELYEAWRTNLRLKRKLYDLGSDAGVAELFGLVRRERLEVLFLDPLNGFLSGIAKDLANTTLATPYILRLAERAADSGCTLVLLCHTAGDRARNSDARRRHQPLALSDLMWPAVSNSARQWVVTGAAADYDDENHVVRSWLTIGGSASQRGGTFHATAAEGPERDRLNLTCVSRRDHLEQHAGEAAHEENRERVEQEQRVLGVVQRHPQGIHLTGILRALRQGQARWLRPTLDDLVSQQRLRAQEERRPGAGNTNYYYPIPPVSAVVSNNTFRECANPP